MSQVVGTHLRDDVAGARRWAATAAPVWVRVLLVYLLARVFSAVVLVVVARHQAPSEMGGAQPDYVSMLGLWDAQWYQHIAEQGYPNEIPRDAVGRTQQNPWAFYPLFPGLVGLLTGLTGLDTVVAAAALALVLGAGAVVVMFRLLAQVAGPRLAWGTVVLFSCAPASPVLQVAYSESLATLLLCWALLLLVRRRYLAALPATVLLGLSRPLAAPMAGVVLVHLLRRWRHRRTDPFRRPESVRALVLGAGTGAAALLWPLVAWAVTGERSAYIDTESAWRGQGSVVAVRLWLDVWRELFGDRLGPVLLGVLLAAFAVLVLSRPGARMGGDLQAWCLIYVGYLLVALGMLSSVFRCLLLLFPLGAVAVSLSRRRVYLAALVVVNLVLQVVWVAWLWRFSPPTDWPP